MRPILKYILFGIVTAVVAFVLIALPRNLVAIGFTLLVVYPLLTTIIFYVLSNGSAFISAVSTRTKHYLATVPITERQAIKFHWYHLLEITLILVLVLFATRHHFNFDPAMRVDGHEIEWLTGYGQIAHQGLEELGRIPRWIPYYRQGEPLVDSAFSYIFNPFSSIPHLLYGSTQGTKYSVTINAGLASLGGWFLGWMLGLSRIGRVGLALMLLSKGNMHANFNGGYYQLALQQVYFPWVIAGILGVIRTEKRWAIILSALSMALMFLAGNIWHVLPTGISVLVILFLYIRFGKYWSRELLYRLLWVGIITIGLSAVLFLRTITTFDLIDKHPDEVRAGWEVVDAHRAYLLPFAPDYEFATDYLPHRNPARGNSENIPNLHFYYSYVAPWWFVLLLLLPLPMLWRKRGNIPNNNLVWIAGLGLYVLFTMWGMGGTPLFLWLYENVPYLAQWRFVPRAFGMASFWIAVLVAMRMDTVIQSLFYRWRQTHTSATGQAIFILLIVYVSAGTIALLDVTGRWRDDGLSHIEPEFGRCIEWFGQSTTSEKPILWAHGYNRVTQKLQNKVSLYNIEADYEPSSSPNTIGNEGLDFRNRFTEYRFFATLEQLSWYLAEGYRPAIGSPNYHRIENCIYTNPFYNIPYAFIFTEDDLLGEKLLRNPHLTSQYMNELAYEPVSLVVLAYDTVGVRVRSDDVDELILVIQELGYPGWHVTVDGETYPREVFARLNAVKLPADGQVHEVIFSYQPPLLYIGGIITILTSGLSILYLLRVDRFVRRKED